LYLSDQFQRIYEEVGFSILFKKEMFTILTPLATGTAQYLQVDKLAALYQSIMTEITSPHLPQLLYNLYGGGVFTIESKKFREKVIAVITQLGKTLSTSESIVTRNIEDFKKNR
jgi:hypothetical protein